MCRALCCIRWPAGARFRRGVTAFMGGNLIAQLPGRAASHPRPFSIALLFASVALDWLGYLFRSSGLSRAGFYTLTLGAAGAGSPHSQDPIKRGATLPWAIS